VRGHREGSVYQRGRDGLWVAAISLPGGQRRRAYAKTRAEVEAKLRKMQAVETFLGPTIPAPPTMILPPSLSGARRTTLPTRLGPQYLAIAAESGWIVRSVPEARIAVVLGRLGLTPWNTAAQYKVGRLRIDFAAPDVSVAIEVDGPHHRLPRRRSRTSNGTPRSPPRVGWSSVWMLTARTTNWITDSAASSGSSGRSVYRAEPFLPD
jgi:hypothetical protein